MGASRFSPQFSVVGLVLPVTIKKANELSCLIMVELRLPFLLAGGATAADGGSLGASHLSIVMLGCMWVMEVRCGCKKKQIIG